MKRGKSWLVGLVLSVLTTLMSMQGAATVFAAGAVYPTVPAAQQKTFNISAIDVDIPINRWGDHVPSGKMYVLDADIPRVQAQLLKPLSDPANGIARASIGERDDAIQPLVIRANVGDVITINFTNRLTAGEGNAGLLIHGLYMDPDTGYGSAIGLNADSSAAPGQTVTYKYFVPNQANAEGSYVFNSMTDPRGLQMLGLFGVLNVEPAGSTYFSPITGQPQTSGFESMIVDPSGKDFREDTIIYHEFGDETFGGILSAAGGPLPINDSLGTYRPGSRALNYRSEPFFRRQDFLNATIGWEDEALSYSSYAFGDPPFFQRGYVGDPTKRRIVHAGSERFHSEHLHSGSIRWPFDPTTVADGAKLHDGSPSPDAGRWGGSVINGMTGGVVTNATAWAAAKHPPAQFVSQRLDVQAIGPLETYTEMMEGAAGGLQAFAGETLYHCHFGEHYVGGMWSFWRVYDTLQGDQSLPGQPALAQLPDRAGMMPTAVTSDALIGKKLPGGDTLTTGPTNAAAKQRNIDEWVRTVLPPQDDPANPTPATAWDASVWNWAVTTVNALPRYVGEPELAASVLLPNYKSPTPGVRPAILFNPNNGRPAFPLMRPQVKRPPFAPGRSGSPYLGDPDADHPDSLIPADAARRLEYTIVTNTVPITLNAKFNIKSSLALLMLDEDKAAILAGTKPQEQLTIRSSVGDGVDIFQYNEISDKAKFFPSMSKANVHIHFVQFDTQASDGVISGFSYEQSVRSYLDEGGATPLLLGNGIHLTAASAAGSRTITVDNAATLKVNAFIGIGFGTPRRNGDPTVTNPNGTLNANGGFEMAQIVSKAGNVLTLDRGLLNNHTVGQFAGVEFMREQWWSDAEESTTYFHNHVFSLIGFETGLTGALVVEPQGSQWADPSNHSILKRSGTQVDIMVDPASPKSALASGVPVQNFREFVLHMMAGIHGLTSSNGGGDPGGFNMKEEPLTGNGRLGKNSDPSLLFSSAVHGDPETPVLKTYAGDLSVIRLLNSSGHDATSFAIAGHRFRVDRYDPKEVPKSALNTVIAERFDLIFTAGGVGLQAGDYVYMQSTNEKMLDGAWGLLRVFDTLQPGLAPIRPAVPPSGAGLPVITAPNIAGRPVAATEPNSADDVANVAALATKLARNGYALPAGMPVRTFNISAIPKAISFSTTSNISTGRAYVLAENEAAVVAGTKALEPLVIRANVGDIVRINFTNHLAATGQAQPRASLNIPELIKSTDSLSSAFGFNKDSTVAPGQTTTMWAVVDSRYEVPRSFIFGDQGDPVNGGANGLYGMFIVEPAGSTYHDPRTGLETKSGAVVDVHNTSGSFRDIGLIFHDNDHVMNRDIMPYQKNVDISKGTGINYRSAPFAERLALNSAINRVLQTNNQHGDPTTPIIECVVGDQVRVHMGQGFGQQVHVATLDGYDFPFEPSRPNGLELYARAMGPKTTVDMVLSGGGGGVLQARGDFLYRDGRNAFFEAGMWGIMRVKAATDSTLTVKLLPSAIPTTPTNLQATATSSTQVALTWVDTSNNETMFMVQRATDANFTQNMVEIHTAANITAFNDLTVVSNTKYFYRVIAGGAVSNSAPSGVVNVTTPAAVVVPPPPASGGGGGGGGGGGTPPPAPAAKAVRLDGLTSGTGLNTDDSGKVQSDAQVKSSNDDIVMNLPSGTKMVDKSGQRVDSLTSSIMATPPTAPTGSKVVNAFEMGPTGTQFTPPISLMLKVDPAKIPSGVAEKDLVMAFFDTDANKWVALPTTVDTIAHTLTGTVSHFTTFAVITPSAAAPEPPPVAAAAPTAPKGLTASVTSAGAVSLTWTDTSSNEAGFMIERAEDVAFTKAGTDFHVAANSTAFLDTTVVAGKTYFYKVLAVHSVGTSDPSNSVSVTIAAAPPPPTTTAPPVKTTPATTVAPTTSAPAQEPAKQMNWILIGAGALAVLALLGLFIGLRRGRR